MRIFNETKSQEIQEENIDYSKYKLAQTKLFVKHHEAVTEVKEQSHYEVIKVYNNGGKDVKKVVDVAGIKARPAYDEYEDILYLVPLTQTESIYYKITNLKQKLAKYKEDVEQVELFDMERSDYEQKKQMCANIILELRQLEKNVK